MPFAKRFGNDATVAWSREATMMRVSAPRSLPFHPGRWMTSTLVSPPPPTLSTMMRK